MNTNFRRSGTKSCEIMYRKKTIGTFFVLRKNTAMTNGSLILCYADLNDEETYECTALNEMDVITACIRMTVDGNNCMFYNCNLLMNLFITELNFHF